MHYLYNQKIHYHADLLELLKLELKSLPEGSMRRSGGESLYQKVKGREVGITNNIALITQYCRKALVLFLVKHLEKERTLPAHLHQKLSIKDIIKSLPASYQGFPQHYYFHSQYNTWLGIKSLPQNFHTQNLKYPSSKNTFVRSKSEMIITNFLENQKIPFIYEAPLKLNGHALYPDFLIFCPYTAKLIPWEHFGLLDDPQYLKKMRDKVALFHQLGFQLFENIIYTFEPDITDPNRIQEIIEDTILNPKL